MEIRTDTHLKGQNYSDLSMLFYTVAWPFTRSGSLCVLNTSRKHTDTKSSIGFLAQHISHLGLHLGVNITIWGFVLGCHAACTTFAGLVVCRTLLGIFESYVAPILVLIIAMWHKKEQRVSWFYVCNSLTTIFGSFLTYGVGFAKTNFAKWRIFFMRLGH